MGQIPGYKHDIFISYTHNDNAPIGNDPGWVDTFHTSLENWLAKRRRLSDLKIWRDKKRMQGNTAFNDAIKSAVKDSALLFALNSRNYLESAYCQDELAWFHEDNSKRAGGLKVGDELRVFNILLNNIPHAEWPEALGETAGFCMHDAEDKELGDFTPASDANFQKQLRQIVDAVEAIIEKFPKTAEEKPQEEVVKIFVADVPESLQDFRERVVTEAEGVGAQILAGIPLPMAKEEHNKKVKKAIAKADFSIHLLDDSPGRKIKDKKNKTYPREQCKIAQADSIPQLIWVPGELKVDKIVDKVQRQFIQKLATGDREGAQFQFIQRSKTEFINILLQQISEQTPPGNGAVAGTFLIDTHQKDQRYAFKLADYLSEQGEQVEFNQESRDPTRSLEYFQESITHVKNLIIIFGLVGPAWLQGRIKKAFKTVSEQFDAEDTFILENIWIYLTPASNGQVELPRFPPLIKINILDNSHDEAIDKKEVAKLFKTETKHER